MNGTKKKTICILLRPTFKLVLTLLTSRVAIRDVSGFIFRNILRLASFQHNSVRNRVKTYFSILTSILKEQARTIPSVGSIILI